MTAIVDTILVLENYANIIRKKSNDKYQRVRKVILFEEKNITCIKNSNH